MLTRWRAATNDADSMSPTEVGARVAQVEELDAVQRRSMLGGVPTQAKLLCMEAVDAKVLDRNAPKGRDKTLHDTLLMHFTAIKRGDRDEVDKEMR